MSRLKDSQSLSDLVEIMPWRLLEVIRRMRQSTETMALNMNKPFCNDFKTFYLFSIKTQILAVIIFDAHCI